MRRIFLWLAFPAILMSTGCREEIKPPDVSGIQVDPVHIRRYERALFNNDHQRLPGLLDSLYRDYGFFLGEEYRDTLNLIRISNFLHDPLILELKDKTEQVFPDLGDVESDLTLAFKRLKYYLPDHAVPEVYSYISGLYYEAPVEYFDTVMIISLDLFLGPDFEPYRAIGLPMYMARRMTPGAIVPECMEQIGIRLLPEALPEKTLLDQMILHGKVLYFLDLALPDHSEPLKIGFTPEQIQWCKENEQKMWSLFIEKEMLYSADPVVISRFIQDGPFTSGLPESSPAMLGRWIGWQIIKSFMRTHPKTTVEELFGNTDSQGILSASRYKPSRD